MDILSKLLDFECQVAAILFQSCGVSEKQGIKPFEYTYTVSSSYKA